MTSKCQDFQLETIFIQDKDSLPSFEFPFFRHRNKDIQEQINRVLCQNVINEFSLSEINKTAFSELNYKELDWIESCRFLTHYNKNSIISIEFILNGRNSPLPSTFIRTIDLSTRTLIDLKDIINSDSLTVFYSLINKMLNKDIDELIRYLDEDEETKDNKEYYLDCYNNYRNQKTFGFYIQELNKGVIISTGCCCRRGADNFSNYYFGFLEIRPFLKKDYQARIN